MSGRKALRDIVLSGDADAVRKAFEGKETVDLSETFAGMLGISKKQKIEAIACSLEGNKTLTGIYLDRNDIGDEGVKAITSSLKENKTLTKISLNRNNIGDEGAKAIASFLEGNKTLTEIYLGSNNIGPEGAKAIASSLKWNKTLTEIYLGSNDVGDEGAKAIASFLEGNKTLTRIYLGSNDIGPEGAKAIASSLKGNKTLTEIYLGSNDIGDEGVKAIASFLEGNKTLTEISLNGNDIGPEGAKAMASVIEGNKTLTGIYLNSNDIGDEGVKAITSSLEVNKTLTVISLNGNDIGDEGAKAIAYFLEGNKMLAKIYLNSNDIGDEGVKAIASSLAGNKTLTKIYLDSNKISPEGAKAIASSLERNKTLNEISLNGNDIGPEGVKAFTRTLQRNDVLTHIGLDSDNVDYEVRKEFEATYDDAQREKRVEANAKARAEAEAKARAEEEALENPGNWAISFEQLLELRKEAMEVFGHEFNSKNMYDVNKKIITPKYGEMGISYALAKNPKGLKAEVFVSHNWAEPFGEFVNSIVNAFDTKFKKPSLWICAFGLVQGTSDAINKQLDMTLEQSPFVRALKSAEIFLVVRNSKTDLYSRIWCICEVMYAEKFNFIPNKLHVAGPRVFIDEDVSCLNAQASQSKDKAKILKVLLDEESSYNHEKIDEYITDFRKHHCTGVASTIHNKPKIANETHGTVEEFLGTAWFSAMKSDLDDIGVEIVDDLQLLDEEDIDMLASKLKKIQKKKFLKRLSEVTEK